MMRINCDTAQEYYLQQAIKDKLQGYSFTHPKCTASKLLQLATELQKLKEEFYTGGNYTCDPPPHHTHTHRATASHTPNVRPANYYSWLPNYRNSRRSSIPEVIIHVTPPPPHHTHTHRATASHTPNVRPANYYSWLPNYRNSRRSSIPEVIIHVTPPPTTHTHTGLQLHTPQMYGQQTTTAGYRTTETQGGVLYRR